MRDENVKSLNIKLKGNVSNPKLAIDPTKLFSLPINSTPSNINSLVNSILKLDGKRKLSLQFSILNKLLNTSIEEFFDRHSLDFENVVTIEYSESFDFPSKRETIDTNEWVEAVQFTKVKDLGYLVFGDFSGSLGISGLQNGSLDTKSIKNICHTGGIKSLVVLDEFSCGKINFLTAGKDLKLKLWTHSTQRVKPTLILSVPTPSVFNVICARDSNFATAGTDNCVRLWEFKNTKTLIKNSEENYQKNEDTRKEIFQNNKRAKTDKTEEGFKEILTMNNVHYDNVSALCWPFPYALYSGSWDRKIVYTDTERGSKISSWSAGDVVTSLDFSLQHNLGLSSQCNGTLKAWDFRIKQPEVRSSAKEPKSFKKKRAWLSQVRWSNQRFGFVSSGYDGFLDFWDLRIQKMVGSANAMDGKIYDFDFCENNTIACGGERGVNLVKN